ncbi:MAG: hypothetical protein ABSA29_19000, partial [Terriglobales bacterium]
MTTPAVLMPKAAVPSSEVLSAPGALNDVNAPSADARSRAVRRYEAAVAKMAPAAAQVTKVTAHNDETDCRAA